MPELQNLDMLSILLGVLGTLIVAGLFSVLFGKKPTPKVDVDVTTDELDELTVRKIIAVVHSDQPAAEKTRKVMAIITAIDDLRSATKKV
jgi:hypothetical protein